MNSEIESPEVAPTQVAVIGAVPDPKIVNSQLFGSWGRERLERMMAEPEQEEEIIDAIQEAEANQEAPDHPVNPDIGAISVCREGERFSWKTFNWRVEAIEAPHMVIVAGSRTLSAKRFTGFNVGEQFPLKGCFFRVAEVGNDYLVVTLWTIGSKLRKQIRKQTKLAKKAGELPPADLPVSNVEPPTGFNYEYDASGYVVEPLAKEHVSPGIPKSVYA